MPIPTIRMGHRARLLCCTAFAVAVLGLPAAVYAQSAAASDQVESGAEAEADIIVTGTSIRGIPPTGSGLISVTREDAKLIGAASTAELLATVPQLNSFNTAPRVSNNGLGSFAPGLRGNKAAYATIPALSLLLALPFFLGFAAADRWEVALALLFVPLFLNSFFLPATVTFIQSEVAPSVRVISGALLLLVMNLVGLGPTFVGIASDFFRPAYGVHSLQMAFYALAPMYLIAAFLFLWLARLIKRGSSTDAA